MKADLAAEHLDGGLEQDHGGGAVHVVVAVEKHRLARGDGALQALDGRGHAQHEEGIVEMRRLGIEEGEGLAAVVMPRATSSSASTSGRRASRARAAAASGCGSARSQRWRQSAS
jgi:hypothetical protein